MARALWTGALNFGLVNIPVRLYSATRAHDVRFHQIAPDGSRVHNKRVSEKTGREVDYDDIKKGYALSKNKVVVFERDELAELAPAATKTVDIEDFVALDEIDPIYYERTYHVAPANDAASHAYALLTAVMEDRGRVGIGKVVLREKQYLAAIRPYGKGLVLSTMLFADEVVDQRDVDNIPARRPALAAREKDMAAQILDGMARAWDPKRYHDDYEEQLRSVIRAKAKGQTIEVPASEAAEPLDLLAALQASLDKHAPPRANNRSTTRAKKSTSKATKSRAKRARPAPRRSR